MEGLEHIRAIAWDFDGVLNRDCGSAWHKVLAEEFAIDPETFAQVMFHEAPRVLFCGEEDVLDRLERWAERVRFEGDVEEVLLTWYREDLALDQAMLKLMEQLDGSGVAQVLATNNEARRIRYVLEQGGLDGRLDAVFASGEIGAMKPEPGFFAAIEATLGLEPAEILLIDDSAAHVEAAEKRGWLGWQYEPRKQMALAEALMPLMLPAT